MTQVQHGYEEHVENPSFGDSRVQLGIAMAFEEQCPADILVEDIEYHAK